MEIDQGRNVESESKMDKQRERKRKGETTRGMQRHESLLVMALMNFPLACFSNNEPWPWPISKRQSFPLFSFHLSISHTVFMSVFFQSFHFSHCLYVCFLSIFTFFTLSLCLFSFYLCIIPVHFVFLPVSLSFWLFLSVFNIFYLFLCMCVFSIFLSFFLSIF